MTISEQDLKLLIVTSERGREQLQERLSFKTGALLEPGAQLGAKKKILDAFVAVQANAESSRF